MPLLRAQPLLTAAGDTRTYNVQVPAAAPAPPATVPAIIVFHGGGQATATIARAWGVDPPRPVPAAVGDYLLVFPETHPQMEDKWVHFSHESRAFPTLDLDFVRDLIVELTTRAYPTGPAPGAPTVSADPDRIYAAGFSNGAGMVWQLLNSDLSTSIRGYAAVGEALDPEKVEHYRQELAAVGQVPAPAPVFYLQGTADENYRPPFTQHEVSLEETLPFFTLQQMLRRNVVPAGPAATTLVAGATPSTGVTEVVLQEFTGTETYVHGTVINGGHNWPAPGTVGNPPVATHVNATQAIIDFWIANAGL